MSGLGKEIKEIRESRGITLDDVYRAIRINKEYLEKIENDNFSFMPVVYVKAFIKDYVNYLNLNEKVYLSRLEEILNPPHKRAIPDLNKSDENEGKETNKSNGDNNLNSHNFDYRTKKKTWPLVILAFVVLILILFIFYGNIRDFIFGNEEKTNVAVSSEERYSENQPKTDTGSVAQDRNTLLSLVISAKDKVWIQVSPDGKNTISATIIAGEQRTFTAKEYFEILTGNVGNTLISLNGKEYPLFGTQNLVRRFRLDSSGIKYLTVPSKNIEKKIKSSDTNG